MAQLTAVKYNVCQC